MLSVHVSKGGSSHVICPPHVADISVCFDTFSVKLDLSSDSMKLTKLFYSFVLGSSMVVWDKWELSAADYLLMCADF